MKHKFNQNHMPYILFIYEYLHISFFDTLYPCPNQLLELYAIA